jgi:DNA-binding Xre family transcriptional regulator
MAVHYNRLFHMMIDKEVNNAQLKDRAVVSANIITRLKNDDSVSEVQNCAKR